MKSMHRCGCAPWVRFNRHVIRGRKHAVRPKLAEALRHHRLPERLAESLLREAADWPDRDLHDLLACMLAARMCLSPIDLAKARGILLIGPSGSGKSAVAEKL